MDMRRHLIAAIVIAFAAWLCPAPEAKAFDPITISLLAPMAMDAANTAGPYMLQGLCSAGQLCAQIGGDLLDVFRLPLGVLELTLGLPFGLFNDGLSNCVSGIEAPFCLCWHVVILPVSLFAGGAVH